MNTITQHTRGPWFYDGQNGCGSHIIHVAQGEIAEAFGDSWGDDGQQAAANARLIAAAPDLLESCIAMIAAFGGDVPDWLRGEVAQMELAIAKATSNQP